MRVRHPLLLVAAALLLAGCSSAGAIDVPQSGSTVAAVTRSPSASASVSTRPGLDCAAALPAGLIEADIGLPAGTVTETSSADGCSYGIAGNPTAVVVDVGPARLTDTFVGAGEAVGATPAPFGEASYRLDGSASSPSELAILAGGYELHVESYVGDQGVLAEWAVAVLASLDVAAG